MPNRNKRIAIGVGGAVAAALSIALPALMSDEGKRNVDYLDIARVPTACYGHTGRDVKVGRRRTDSECQALLSDDANVHMAGALRCTPQLADRPYQLAAVTRFTFNVGVAGYCRSTSAKWFAAGEWRRGCDALLAWDKARVNGRVVRVNGLALRRQRERAMCVTGL